MKSLRFGIISDPHIALPHTIWDHPNRLHLVELSIPVLEAILERFSQLELDFLLLPGDLTQHGEPDNHRWLAERLAQLPYPAYVVPGNHDVPTLHPGETSIGLFEFPQYYSACGYDDPTRLYYTQEVHPGVRLIGLNSNQFDAQGNQVGRVDDQQLHWLQQVLQQHPTDLCIVMVHHNLLEHLPGQSRHPMGRRYMLDNAAAVVALLQQSGVQLVVTGHLHVQDIAHAQGLYDITTGSLVTYPHPYRVVQISRDGQGQRWLQVESDRVEAVPGWAELQQASRELMGMRSQPFMLQLLTYPPLSLPKAQAADLAPSLRYFWADIAAGDAMFDFPEFPPNVRRYFQQFSAVDPNGYPHAIDNQATFRLD